MVDDRKPRFVSGEIMAASRRSGPKRIGAIAPDAAIDAEFELVAATRIGQPETREAQATASGAGLQSLRSSEHPAGGARLFWAVGTVVIAASFWAAGGHALVATDDDTRQGGRDMHPLRIENVASRTEDRDGRSVLFVEGDARNGGSQAHTLPAITLAVVDGSGAAMRYVIDTGQTELSPGQRYAFSSRMEAPDRGVKSVTVTFREETR